MKVILDLPALYQAHNFFYPKQKVYTDIENLKEAIESASISDKKLEIYAIAEEDKKNPNQFISRLEDVGFKVILNHFADVRFSPPVGNRSLSDFQNTSPIITFLMSRFASEDEDRVMIVTNKFEPYSVMPMILDRNPSFQLQVCFFLDLLDARWLRFSQSKNYRFFPLTEYRQDIFGRCYEL